MQAGNVVRVLLVEDEVRLAEAIQRGLGAEGFQVELVHEGHRGLLRATSSNYDVVVLDIMVPGLSGYRICQEMRKAGVWTPC